jgi:hypothetical protein
LVVVHLRVGFFVTILYYKLGLVHVHDKLSDVESLQ